MNIMSIDIGKKRTGICLCLEGILLPQESFKTEALQEKVSYFTENYPIESVVVGLPLDSEGGMTDMAAWIKSEAEKLRLPGSVKVDFFNERLTTKEAERIIREDDFREKGKKNIDSISAMIILKEYLENEKK